MSERFSSIAVTVTAPTQELADKAASVLADWLSNSGEQDWFAQQEFLSDYGRGEEVMADWDFRGVHGHHLGDEFKAIKAGAYNFDLQKPEL